MKSKLEMKRSFLAEISVEVPAEKVDAAVNKAYATLSRTARIRGFRQGKAPRPVLKRMFGEAILHEVRGDIINDALPAALIEHDLIPLSQPSLDAGDVKEGASYAFTATFEVRPKLDAVVYDGVELERSIIKVEESEVDTELDRLRSAMASVEELPSPRPVEKGDAAIISLRRPKDDGWEESGLNDQQVVVGDGQAPEAVETALLGMNIGDEKVVDMGPETEPEEKRMRYLVKLTDLKSRKLPALDDELAKDTGEFDTLDALKEDIRKRIGEAKERTEDRRLRTVLWEALCEKNPMELPPALVARQADALKSQLYRGVLEELQKNPEEAGDSLKRLAESADNTASEMVHQQLLMMEIARINDIKIEDTDIDEEIAKRAAEAGIPAPLLRAEMNKAGRQDEFATQILETKIFDFAKSLVKITGVEGEVKRPEKAAPKTKKSADAAEKADATAADNASEEMTGTETTGKKATKKATKKKNAAEKTDDKDAASKKAPAKKAAAKKTATKKSSDGTAAKKITAKKAATKKAPAQE